MRTLCYPVSRLNVDVKFGEQKSVLGDEKCQSGVGDRLSLLFLLVV